MKVLIKTDFSGYSDDGLVTKTDFMVTKMTGNLNFPTPSPALDVVTTKEEAFQDALTAAQNGGRSRIILKNQLRAELIVLLQTLGYYVQLNCKNDPVIAASSGFDIRQTGSPYGILDSPEYVKVEFGPVSGSIKITTNKIKGAKVYVIQWALSPVTESTHWEEDISSKRTYLKEGLTPGKEYAFRVAGKGASSTLVFSEIMTHVVV